MEGSVYSQVSSRKEYARNSSTYNELTPVSNSICYPCQDHGEQKESNPHQASCYTSVANSRKLRSQHEHWNAVSTCINENQLVDARAIFKRVSQVIQDRTDFYLLCSVIGPERKLAPLFQPIRGKNKTYHDLVARVFPRFKQFGCFEFDFSLGVIGIFSSSNWLLWLLWFWFHEIQSKIALKYLSLLTVEVRAFALLF